MDTIKAMNNLGIKPTEPKFRIMIEQRTQLKFSGFYDTKN